MFNINDLIELVGSEGESKIKPSIFVARVTKSYPDIELLFMGMSVFKEQIVYTSWSKILAEGNKTQSSTNHDHKINFGGLNKGDDVLIYKMSDSEILILDKVVS